MLLPHVPMNYKYAGGEFHLWHRVAVQVVRNAPIDMNETSIGFLSQIPSLRSLHT